MHTKEQAAKMLEYITTNSPIKNAFAIQRELEQIKTTGTHILEAMHVDDLELLLPDGPDLLLGAVPDRPEEMIGETGMGDIEGMTEVEEQILGKQMIKSAPPETKKTSLF